MLNQEVNQIINNLKGRRGYEEKKAKKLGRSIHYGKYMIESQIDLAGSFLDLW